MPTICDETLAESVCVRTGMTVPKASISMGLSIGFGFIASTSGAKSSTLLV